ncbi:MAG: peptidylprolyl isomerase [Elusimicrobia bacterium]|nr:peptidylprolyl isomerase [Elusimicrobiota bacterium]
MKKTSLFAVLAIFLAACSRDYVARVGTKKITVEEFKNRMLDVPTYYRGFLETDGGRRQYLDGIVNESILVELAKAKGIHRRPAVKTRLEALKDQILLEYIVDELKKDKLKVTEKEIDDYYEEHKDFYLHPPRVRVSHILVPTENEAEKIYKQIKEGASFSDLAKKKSIDRETASRGGDLGFFEKGEMVPAFENAAFALKNIGDISPVVKTAFGWHIIKLTGKSKAAAKTKEEARDEIEQIIRKQKLEKLLAFYKKKLGVKINYDLVAKTEPPWQIPGEKEVGQENEK